MEIKIVGVNEEKTVLLPAQLNPYIEYEFIRVFFQLNEKPATGWHWLFNRRAGEQFESRVVPATLLNKSMHPQVDGDCIVSDCLPSRKHEFLTVLKQLVQETNEEWARLSATVTNTREAIHTWSSDLDFE